MGNTNYQPLYDDFVWSYSRIETFKRCPYAFYLKYIRGSKDEPMFYSDYGRFMHSLIERHYAQNVPPQDLYIDFLTGFSSNVKGKRPGQSTVEKYIKGGLDYFQNFSPFPFTTIAVEKEFNFNIDGIKFTGVVDYIGEDNGDIYIIDNKSRDLKQPSGKQKPTKNDIILEDMSRQLYIYAHAVREEYGKFPKALCFNCFRTGVFITLPFDENAYNSAIQWVKDSIKEIYEAEDFVKNENYFSCSQICGVNRYCR